jgi:putative hemolysin
MTAMSRLMAPIVWLLDASTRAIFRLFGQSTAPEAAITEEEIKTLLAEAAKAGVIEVEERAMIAGILRLGDRKVSGIMTPRLEVDLIDLADAEETIKAKILGSSHARLPVSEAHPDNVIGVVQIRDVLAALLAGNGLDLRALVRPVPVIPDTLDAIGALERLREAETPMALVHDEFGQFEGVVTPADLFDAIAGAFRSEDRPEPDAVQRQDGSWLFAGSMPADEMAEITSIALPPARDYQTVAGFIIAQLERLPATGESLEAEGWRFEVVDMDGRRVDKVLATRLSGENRTVAASGAGP